jgi:hypothetical protein
MRGLVALLVLLTGCVPPDLKPPGYVSDGAPNAPTISAQISTPGASVGNQLLEALATRVGLDHGAARAAVGCGLASQAREFLAVQERREHAMRDMRDGNRALMIIATTASARHYVALQDGGDAGCRLARDQAREAARSDPWRGLYGTSLHR